MSAYWIALASGTLQQTGGSFPLTAQANFGINFGLTAVNFTSTTASPATAGTIRLAKTDTIDWHNNLGSANLPLGINGSDQLTYNGAVISTILTNGTVNTGTAGRLTLYPSTGNAVDDVYIQNAFGIDLLIAAQPARSIPLEYSIPNPGNAVAAATFALLELAQTFTALQTFSQTVTISATTNQLVLGITNTTTISSTAPVASRTVTLPDAGINSSFVLTEGTQTINGSKTFGADLAMGGNKITGLAAGVSGTDAANVSQIAMPTGAILLYGASPAPSGWTLCDGSAISRTTFSALFAVIGTTYGVGDGSTTFNVPNFINFVGVGVGGSIVPTLGSSSGATSVVPTSPAHTHTIAHQHDTINCITNGGATGLMRNDNPYGTTSANVNYSDFGTTAKTPASNPYSKTSGTLTANSGSTAVTIDSTSVVQPSLGVNYIIKN